MTQVELATSLAYKSGTVVRDASGEVWRKKWLLWQRFGSLGDYDTTAIVTPWTVLYEP